HEVAPGAADRSYGIHVAKLAGLPKPVLSRAEAILKILEQSRQTNVASKLIDSLPLFANAPVAESSSPAPLEQMLMEINPDVLTPKEALELVYKLKSLF